MVDVVGFIEGTITLSDASNLSVFQLKDLSDMLYIKQMADGSHGASAEEIETVHTSREKS